MTLMTVSISWGAAAGITLAALLMVLTPGPNMIYLISRSIAQGRIAGLISLAGTGIGFLVYMTMANLGLAAVFAAVPWVYVTLKAAGVLYLGYLAWKALRPGGTGVFETVELRRYSAGKLFRMGLITNLLNPKTAVMYLTLIPQFIDSTGGSVATQGFILGGIQVTVSLIVNAALVLAAGSIAGFIAQRPAWARAQRRVAGTLLGVVAVLLAKEVPQTVQT
jgi:threonine/homoserine/homoserine lactone efflux protein